MHLEVFRTGFRFLRVELLFPRQKRNLALFENAVYSDFSENDTKKFEKMSEKMSEKVPSGQSIPRYGAKRALQGICLARAHSWNRGSHGIESAHWAWI